MSKNSEKSSKKSHLGLNFPLLKCFLVTHNFLDWCEILNTQTRPVCATFPTSFIEFGHLDAKVTIL